MSADRQDQFTFRIDHHINDHQNFSFYYYYTDDNQLQPFYNFQASGANIPGFGAKVGSRYQQYNPSHTWTITNTLVNEARFTYMREGQLTFQHPKTLGPSRHRAHRLRRKAFASTGHPIPVQARTRSLASWVRAHSTGSRPAFPETAQEFHSSISEADSR